MYEMPDGSAQEYFDTLRKHTRKTSFGEQLFLSPGGSAPSISSAQAFRSRSEKHIASIFDSYETVQKD
jgi:hypothetical protein